MKHYLLYAHGGAYNHGSEASVKCDIKLLRRISPNCKITLSSHFPEQDRQLRIEADEIVGRNLNGKTNEEIYADTISSIMPETIALSVGGDCYCYPNWQRYAAIHNAAIKRGAKSILWSCSLEPSLFDKEMLEVLRTHTLICARESFTYNALKKRGFANVVQTADIAFTLEPEKTEIPDGAYIAINLSPLVMRKNPNIRSAYQNLVDHILENTRYWIALVPHVEVSVDNDVEALAQLKGDESRIFRVPVGLNAAQYKYVISKADFCVASRTHATIAAWSSLVPTIAVGYSLKARGIAEDLGQGRFVMDAGTLDGDALCSAFDRLISGKAEIIDVLAEKVPICTKLAICEDVISILE